METAEPHKITDRYVLAIRILHWLMAAAFLFMWGCGYVMTSIVSDDSSLEELLFGLHISLGVSLLGLLAFRIVLRFLTQAPRLPQGLAAWERTASRLGHLGLYLLPVLIIFIGWAETDFGGHGVQWFGVAMPKVFPTTERLWGLELEAVTSSLHAWLAYAMMVLATIHVGAVLKHRYLDGHDVLPRMLFGRGGCRPEE